MTTATKKAAIAALDSTANGHYSPTRYFSAVMHPRTLAAIKHFAELEQESMSAAIEYLVKAGLRARGSTTTK